MSNSSPDASGPSRRFREQLVAAQTSSAETEPESPLLEHVLEETFGKLLPEEDLSADDRQALADVARRHRGQPLSLDPVARELVHALLRNSFADTPGFEHIGPLVSGKVAATLMDDPTSAARLDGLWNRLAGEVP